MKKKQAVKVVTRYANIRHYAYEAILSPKTGALLRIEAGCRQWKSFDEARSHYRGTGKYGHCGWADSNIADKRDLRYAWREEARSLLSRLFWDVQRAQQRIRNKHKAANKKKKK